MKKILTARQINRKMFEAGTRNIDNLREICVKMKCDTNKLLDSIEDSLTAALSNTNHNLDMTQDEIDAGVKNGRLAAIRLYRDRTGLGLKESKDHVEAHFNKFGYKFADWNPA